MSTGVESSEVHPLVCLGLSHRTAPVELRERLGALGAGAERCPVVREHASLQTCYRVELYARLTAGVEDAGEVQSLRVAADPATDAPEEPLHARIARRAARWGPGGTVGLVVGATAPDELRAIRAIGSMSLVVSRAG